MKNSKSDQIFRSGDQKSGPRQKFWPLEISLGLKILDLGIKNWLQKFSGRLKISSWGSKFDPKFRSWGPKIWIWGSKIGPKIDPGDQNLTKISISGTKNLVLGSKIWVQKSFPDQKSGPKSPPGPKIWSPKSFRGSKIWVKFSSGS